MALALDTNCLLRWLLKDSETQAAIVEDYLTSSKAPLHVADMAFAEVVWVLGSTYGFPDALVESFVRKIVEHNKINCNRALFGQVLDHMNTSPKVSFVDTCLVFYAGLGDAKLLSFDKTLAKKFPRLVKLAD
jgi:predicted nucleic-acid-binding protein